MRTFQLIISAAAFSMFVAFLAIGLKTSAAQPVQIGQAMMAPNPAPGAPTAVFVAPAVQPAPAATIDTGTIAGQALTWVVTVFGGTIAAVASAWLYKLFQKAGIDLNDAQRAKLQEIIQNGLSISAHEITPAIAGKGTVDVRNAVLASTVRYVQIHGADTIKALGGDPLSQTAVDAIKARAMAAINDPATPTPPILDTAPTVTPAKPVAAPAPVPTVVKPA